MLKRFLIIAALLFLLASSLFGFTRAVLFEEFTAQW